MAVALFPVVPNPPQVSAGLGGPQTPTGATVLRDWVFDFVLGDVAHTPDGRAVEQTRPELIVAQECTVNLLIERDSYRVYPRRFGMAYERAQHLPRRPQTHADLEAQVRDQLHRVRGVRDVIEMRWEVVSPDTEWLHFVVTLQPGLPRRHIKALVPVPHLGGRR